MVAYFLSRLLVALRAWDAILLAVALTVMAFVAWPGWLREAREAGALSERLAWMEQQRRAELRREADRRAAQARIDRAEAAAINAMAQSAILRNDLETAIAEADDEDGGGVARDCGLPERVRGALNAIGR